MHAPPKVCIAGSALSGDVEAIGVVVDGGIAVGRGSVGKDQCASRDDDPGEFDIIEGSAERCRKRRAMTHGLLDGIARQLGMLGQQCPLVGVIAQYLHRGGQLIAVVSVPAISRPATSMRNSSALRRSPSSSARISSGDEIVGQRVAPMRDHVVDVGVEFVPRGQDRRLVCRDIPAEEP